jgi:colicin import membrane protein
MTTTPTTYTSATELLETPVVQEFLPPDHPFFYGYRYAYQRINGREEIIQVPLTIDDVLHPQMEDYVTQSELHSRVCRYLCNILIHHLRHEPGTLVFNDVLINWGVQGIGNHSPDVTVLRGVHTNYPTGTFQRVGSGGDPVLVMEVTSPNTLKTDIDNQERPRNKFREYARVGIPYYVIIANTHQEEGHPPPIFAYRLSADGHYELIPPDEQGRVWIAPVELYLGSYDDRVMWFTPEGAVIPDISEALEAMEWALDDTQELLEAEQRERAAAERRAEAERREREAAQQQAEAERREREATESRLRELEAELQQLRDAAQHDNTE